AALTYYGILALFPALIALVSIVGLLGTDTIEGLKDNIRAIPAAGQAKDIVLSTLNNLEAHPGASGIALVFGLGIALFSASGYVGAFMRAANIVYESPEGRPFYRLRPLQVAVTFLMLLLIALSAAAIVVTGPVAEQVGRAVGLGNTGQTVFEVVK